MPWPKSLHQSNVEKPNLNKINLKEGDIQTIKNYLSEFIDLFRQIEPYLEDSKDDKENEYFKELKKALIRLRGNLNLKNYVQTLEKNGKIPELLFQLSKTKELLLKFIVDGKPYRFLKSIDIRELEEIRQKALDELNRFNEII